MRRILIPLAALCLAVAACDLAPSSPDAPAAGATSQQIAWRDGDVQDAFAEAVESDKPVLLYWGAVWCPPCNRLKAGLFQDPAFVARTRDFVPVYLDGDSKGAQAWGQRFGIAGYPTLIVLNPDRSEITRLSGGDPDAVETALAAVQQRRLPAQALLQQALDAPRRLTAADWSLLSQYSWGQDNGRLVAAEATSDTLARLAAAAPTPALQRRFALLALAHRPRDAAALTAEQQARARETLEAVLAHPAEVRANRQTLVGGGARLVKLAATDPADHARLSDALVQAADALYADASLGVSDRLGTASADIALFRASAGDDAAPPPALVDKVRRRVAWADQAARTPYERQSAISTAAHLLAEAGDKPGAERLLTAELERSETPYYYMPSIAGLAEARGDKAGAVNWLRRGYETAEGPATRIQWGTLYVQGLIRLTPRDKAAIEAATAQVIGELADQPDSYHQRTRQRFDTLDKALSDWSRQNDGAATLARLRGQIAGACAAQADAEARAACQGWLSAA